MQTPEISFDKTAFRSKCEAISRQILKSNTRFLVAVKACPIDELLSIALEFGIGFDISNSGELTRVLRLIKFDQLKAPVYISLTGPSLSDLSEEMKSLHGNRLMSGMLKININFDSIAQYHLMKNLLPADTMIGVRLNWSPAADRDSTRFGFDLEDICSLKQICADSRFVGFHAHNYSQNKTVEDYKYFAQSCLDLGETLECSIRSINFGGGLIEEYWKNPVEIVNAIRLILPSCIEIVLEPGHFWTVDLGVAYTTILDIKPMKYREGYFVTLDLSKICHLRWEEPKLRNCFNNLDHNKLYSVLMVGPTCYEMDVLGHYMIAAKLLNGELPLVVGDVLIFDNISGYAVSWNTSFNGIRPASISCI